MHSGMWRSPGCRRPSVKDCLCCVCPPLSAMWSLLWSVHSALCLLSAAKNAALCCCCCCWGCQLILQARGQERACKTIMAGSERVWCVVEHVHQHPDTGIRMMKCTDMHVYTYFNNSYKCIASNASKIYTWPHMLSSSDYHSSVFYDRLRLQISPSIKKNKCRTKAQYKYISLLINALQRDSCAEVCTAGTGSVSY